MWSAVTPPPDGTAPASRAKHSATLLGAHVYLLGGRNGNLPLKDLWRYSLAEGRWTLLSPRGETPPCLQEHSAVAYRDCLYVFGGELGFSAGTETPLWVYNVKSNTWRKVRPPKGLAVPKGRRGHTALVHKDHMLIYGGYRDLRGSSSELWAFHFESETWTLLGIGTSNSSTDMPPARHKHSAVLHDDAMWIYGGMTDLHERADLWRWDTVSRAWTLVRARPGPGPLHSHAACRLPSSMLLFGGERDGHPTSELWRFHFGTETWERLNVFEGPKPQPRAESIALAISDLLLLPNSDQRFQIAAPHHQRGGSVDRSVRNNRVSPCERKYVYHPTSVNYAESSGGFLREISKLSQINLSRLSHHKCSYSVLSHDDSTESLLLSTASSMTTDDKKMVKSQSANIISRKQDQSISSTNMDEIQNYGCNEISDNKNYSTVCTNSDAHDVYNSSNGGNKGDISNSIVPCSLTREPISVPNFGTLSSIPTPVLTPVEVTKLVFIDPDDDFENELGPKETTGIVTQVKPAGYDFSKLHQQFQPPGMSDHTEDNITINIQKTENAIPKSASVRFRSGHSVVGEADALSTSDYASLETVNRSCYSVYNSKPSPVDSISSCCNHNHFSVDNYVRQNKMVNSNKIRTPNRDGPYGFCNPNYLGPDIQTILNQRKSWHDSCSYARLLNSPHDSVLEDVKHFYPTEEESLEMKALSTGECPMAVEKRKPQQRASSASRAMAGSEVQTSVLGPPEPTVPLSIFILGGKEQGQVTVFKRPISVWKLHLTPDIF